MDGVCSLPENSETLTKGHDMWSEYVTVSNKSTPHYRFFLLLLSCVCVCLFVYMYMCVMGVCLCGDSICVFACM